MFDKPIVIVLPIVAISLIGSCTLVRPVRAVVERENQTLHVESARRSGLPRKEEGDRQKPPAWNRRSRCAVGGFGRAVSYRRHGHHRIPFQLSRLGHAPCQRRTQPRARFAHGLLDGCRSGIACGFLDCRRVGKEAVAHRDRSVALARSCSLGPILLLLVFFVAFLALALAGSLSPADGTSTVGAAFMPPTRGVLWAPTGLAAMFWRASCTAGARLLAVAAVSAAVAAASGRRSRVRRSSTKGRFADALSYLLDLLLVIPSILVVMVLVFGLGSGVGTMIVVTTAVSAPYIARYTRSLVRPVAASPYVTAARLPAIRRRRRLCARCFRT